MNELLRRRIGRRLENLADQQGYQVLDYIEFLESKYGTGARAPSSAERLSDTVEDTMRAIRLPGVAIRGTMGAVDAAARLMDRLGHAGRAAVDELGKSLAREDEVGETGQAGQAGQTKEPPGQSA